MRVIGGQYWHLGNGGVTFKVVDKGYGPCLQIQLDSFGGMKQNIELLTDKKSLEKLSVLLLTASRVTNYTKDYCHKLYRH